MYPSYFVKVTSACTETRQTFNFEKCDYVANFKWIALHELVKFNCSNINGLAANIAFVQSELSFKKTAFFFKSYQRFIYQWVLMKIRIVTQLILYRKKV